MGWEVPKSKFGWPRVSSAGKVGKPQAPQNKQQGRIRTQVWEFSSGDRNGLCNRTARQPCLSLLLLIATGVLRKRKCSSLIPPLYLTGQLRTSPGAPLKGGARHRAPANLHLQPAEKGALEGSHVKPKHFAQVPPLLIPGQQSSPPLDASWL